MSKKKKSKSPGKKAEAAGLLVEADRKTHEAVLPYRETPPIKLLSTLSEVGDQPPLLAISGGVLAIGVMRRDRRMVEAGGRMVASHLLATWVKNLIKHRVDRTRPFAARKKEDYTPKPGHNTSKEETSFPSGHSAGALAVAQAVARIYPDHRFKVLTAAGLVAAAQIPRCSHYPTDVGAGLAIGWVSELAVDRAARAFASISRRKAGAAQPA